VDFASAGNFSGGAQSVATVTHDINLAGVETIDANESFVLFVSLGSTAFANGLCLVTADVLPPA
jgi:hypothetical protein